MAYYSRIQGLIWRAVPPPEVTKTRQQIRSFMSEFDTGLFLSPEIERDAMLMTRDVDRTVYSIRVSGMKPDQLALILITNVLANHLPSGWYHVYRGLLSGKGHGMLTIWDRSVGEMRARGYHTEEEAQKDRDWMRAQIKEVG